MEFRRVYFTLATTLVLGVATLALAQTNPGVRPCRTARRTAACMPSS